MSFETEEARAAFRRGAREAFESSVLHMAPPQKRALESWLRELNCWHGGEPPPAPANW
jgi:hypothetical protein